DLAGAIDKIEERGAARPAACRDAPGDAMHLVGFLARGETLIAGEHLRDLLGAREPVRERAGIARTHPLGLGAALGDQLLEAMARALTRGRRRLPPTPPPPAPFRG